MQTALANLDEVSALEGEIKMWKSAKFANSSLQFLRFLIVGAINALAGFLLFLLYFWVIDFHYLVSNVLVCLTWVWFGFELQRYWAFRAVRTKMAFPRYFLNQIGFAGFGTGLLWFLVEFWGFREEFGYLAAVGLTTIGIYLTSRYWVFRSPAPAAGSN